jgi:DNA polymerase-4
MGQALRLCPHAVVVPVRMGAYVEESRRVRGVLERFSPDIEPVSIDEAFVDLSRCPPWRDSPARAEGAAREVKRLIRAETGLTASVGVAPNKFLAKVASDLRKPDGLCVIGPGRAAETLAPMPVGVIWGVGKVAQARLAELNVRTVADLLAFDRRELARRFGDAADHWLRLAVGDDDRGVSPERVSKSIGKERTFGDDVADPARLRAVLMDELEHAARSLREEGLVCRRVALKLRRPDFTTYSRSRVLPAPTDRTPELWDAASALLEAFLGDQPGGTAPLRLLGVRLEDLSAPVQPGLFDGVGGAPRSGRVDAVADEIAARFGGGAIGRAAGLGARSVRKTGNAGRNTREGRDGAG